MNNNIINNEWGMIMTNEWEDQIIAINLNINESILK